MANKAVAPVKTLEEIKSSIAGLKTITDPDYVLREADKELSVKVDGDRLAKPENYPFKAFTLNEFNNGALLTFAVEECYRVFSVDLLRKLREEYQCKTASENASSCGPKTRS